MTGIERIAAERRRQIDQEGWSPEHDAEWDEQMALAAAVYATPPGELMRAPERIEPGFPPDGWPWKHSWWKPGDRIRELEKAGALCAAEIDRLQGGAPQPEMRLVKLHIYCGRMGSLDGLFAVNARGWALLQHLIASKHLVIYGEVLGKHSDVYGPLEEKDLTVLPVSSSALAEVLPAIGEMHAEIGSVTLSGISPLSYLYERLQWGEDEEDGWGAFLAGCGLEAIETVDGEE